MSGNDYLKSTCDTWNPGGRLSINEMTTTPMVTEKSYPSLKWKYFGKTVAYQNFMSIKRKPTTKVSE